MIIYRLYHKPSNTYLRGSRSAKAGLYTSVQGAMSSLRASSRYYRYPLDEIEIRRYTLEPIGIEPMPEYMDKYND